MINKWILNNFKSINKETELEFRPLTIFTGANSSGKSTVLQSILLVTQTLQNPIASRSIVLNGWFKKFGSYSDIVYGRDHSQNINIGFSITEDLCETRDDYFVRRHRIPGTGNGKGRTECMFEVSADGKVENLQPVLEKLMLDVYSEKNKIGSMTVQRGGQRTDEEKKVIDACISKYQPSDFVYTIDSNIKSRVMYFSNRDKWKDIGTGMFHFLPSYAIVYCSYGDQIKNNLSEYLLMGRSVYYDLESDDERKIIPIIKDKALTIVKDIYENRKFRDEITFMKKYNLISKNFTIQRLQAVFKYSTIDGDEKQKYVKTLIDLLDALPESYITEKVPMYYQPGIDFVRSFFCDHIKYLGPLREEPKSLYPLESNGNSSDLGLKGENTAAVFENNKNKRIMYVDPCNYENVAVNAPVPIEATLAEAINKWLIYLGVARDMSTNDRGKFGHELKITTEIADMKQDLTHVGVGVSQILPILVLCFLSEKGDSIILEQPELHLHPKVQTRLADFFVSMNILGKQCIIETHSEYMINRLRYRVAKSEDSSIANNTMMYFVEKDKKTGASNYRSVTINKYGVIEDWPDGFFDESERIAAQILRAGMEKRMKEENDEEDDE